MSDEFKNKCGSCKRMDINKCSGYRFWCNKRDAYYEATDTNICYAYDFDFERDYDELGRKIRNNGCYITTVLCEILGFEDNCEILNIMRTFRNDVLQKDLRYLRLLMEYDVVGPVIANNLRHDENALWIAKELFQHYIKSILKFINDKNYDSAVIVYENMTMLLKENYNISDDNVVIEDYDQSMGGHGKVMVKKTNK